MKQLTLLLLLVTSAWGVLADEPDGKPNVIVILVDDLGYADLGCQGSQDVKTPHIDSIAKNGVRFTHGYVSAPQCGPSRAGLLTGRYQNRFGFESNEFARRAIPTSEKLISDYMKDAGYVTGYVGKWGVGNKQVSGLNYIPPQRGFDESYWNSDGNFHASQTPGKHDVQMHRGNEPVEQPAYSTDAFGQESVAFVERHHDKTFFLFVSYITPHVPMQAKEQDLARFPDVDDPLRQTMLGMMACLDDNVGLLLQTLKKHDLEENTLIFFISDNGGVTHKNASLNDPFRGGKSDILEGGIRIPFLMQWKGKLPAGKVYDQPVISLDILPTALAAAGVEINPKWGLDGLDLLPYVSGDKTDAPHDALYWRFNMWTRKPEINQWAIRQGDWMLLQHGVGRAPVALYDLSKDPSQKNNLAKAHPERVKRMQERWQAWNAEHPELSRKRPEDQQKD